MFEKRDAVEEGERDEPQLQQLTEHKCTLVRLEVTVRRNEVHTEEVRQTLRYLLPNNEPQALHDDTG